MRIDQFFMSGQGWPLARDDDARVVGRRGGAAGRPDEPTPRMAEAHQQVQVRGVELAVRRAGKGVPFVWGHGLQSSMAQEDEAGLFDWTVLSDQVELIRYDARGHGASAGAGGPSAYTWPELGADLVGLLDALHVSRAVIGGASMGCATALHAALLAPDRVRALILVVPPTAWRTRGRQQVAYRVLAGVTGSGILRIAGSTMRWLPEPRLHPGTRRALAQAGLRSALARGGRGMAEPFTGASRSDLPPPEVLAGIDAPALILGWRHDPSHPISTAENLLAALPRASLRIAGSDAALLAWPDEVRRFLVRHDIVTG